MNSKERFDFYIKNGLDKVYKMTAEETVKNLVNNLIQALYIPVKEDMISKVDNNRLEHFKIADNEPINWGDLKCNEVKKFEDGSFLVVIDEAAPSDCETFCDYIIEYMRSYGWECKVETEW